MSKFLLAAALVAVLAFGGAGAAWGAEDSSQAMRQLRVKNFPEAIRLAAPLAEKGDLIAQKVLCLANMMQSPQDWEEALRWCSLCSRGDDRECDYAMFIFYDTGLLVGKNNEVALQYLLRAASGGSFHLAVRDLALSLSTGAHGKRDIDLAIMCSMVYLSRMHSDGDATGTKDAEGVLKRVMDQASPDELMKFDRKLKAIRNQGSNYQRGQVKNDAQYRSNEEKFLQDRLNGLLRMSEDLMQ